MTQIVYDQIEALRAENKTRMFLRFEVESRAREKGFNELVDFLANKNSNWSEYWYTMRSGKRIITMKTKVRSATGKREENYVITNPSLLERKRLTELRMSLTELGEELGVSKATVHNYETGKRKYITKSTAAAIANLMNIKITDFAEVYTGENQEKSKKKEISLV